MVFIFQRLADFIRRGCDMRRITLLLALSFCFIAGCANEVGGRSEFLGEGEIFGQPDGAHTPMFRNGDIVIYSNASEGIANDKRGVVMQCDYKYIHHLKTYCCIVDLYPISIDTPGPEHSGQFQRRYVYEYELELEKGREIPVRWAWMNK